MLLVLEGEGAVFCVLFVQLVLKDDMLTVKNKDYVGVCVGDKYAAIIWLCEGAEISQ